MKKPKLGAKKLYMTKLRSGKKSNFLALSRGHFHIKALLLVSYCIQNMIGI